MFYFLLFSLLLSFLTSSISIAEEQPCPYGIISYKPAEHAQIGDEELAGSDWRHGGRVGQASVDRRDPVLVAQPPGRRTDFQPTPSRLFIMFKAEDR
jgi:hypothetical protein